MHSFVDGGLNSSCIFLAFVEVKSALDGVQLRLEEFDQSDVHSTRSFLDRVRGDAVEKVDKTWKLNHVSLILHQDIV